MRLPIHRITEETIADAAADHVRYLELRFTPIALSKAENFPLKDVISWVVDASEAASKTHNMMTRLIVSVNRQEGPELAEKVLRTAADYRDRGIVGVDLAGNEANYSGLAFLGVFKEARQAGFHITIHAGEWGGPENVMNAILYLGAERIGHGVRIVEDPDVVALARERRIPFEVCLTSNYQSGVVPSPNVHPMTRMINSGLITTLNTDDPSISQITLTDEYYLFCEDLDQPFSALRQCVLNSAAAAFLPKHEQEALMQTISSEFPQSA
jgi:adenosine deaminase